VNHRSATQRCLSPVSQASRHPYHRSEGKPIQWAGQRQGRYSQPARLPRRIPGGPRPCLARHVTIFRISTGSRMRAITDMRPPQSGQAHMSTSYTLASRRAQALRRSPRPTSRSWGWCVEPVFSSLTRPYQPSGARLLRAGRFFQVPRGLASRRSLRKRLPA
jgi:hypothetical protein